MAQTNLQLPKRNRQQEKQAKGLPDRVRRRHNGSKFNKYAAYRNRKGLPLGRGVPGNKAGKNKVSKNG